VGISNALGTGVQVGVRMSFGPPPTVACPLAVLTQLVVAGGDGRSSGCELAVEHGHSARVRSETGHAIAGSFGRRLPNGGLGSAIDPATDRAFVPTSLDTEAGRAREITPIY